MTVLRRALAQALKALGAYESGGASYGADAVPSVATNT